MFIFLMKVLLDFQMFAYLIPIMYIKRSNLVEEIAKSA